jgi:hypothetical protein
MITDVAAKPVSSIFTPTLILNFQLICRRMQYPAPLLCLLSYSGDEYSISELIYTYFTSSVQLFRMAYYLILFTVCRSVCARSLSAGMCHRSSS